MEFVKLFRAAGLENRCNQLFFLECNAEKLQTWGQTPAIYRSSLFEPFQVHFKILEIFHEEVFSKLTC